MSASTLSARNPQQALQTLKATTLTPVIGAEISGVDLSEPLTDGVIDFIRQAFSDHLVLFFRDQKLCPAEHKSFARRFGELHIHPAVTGGVEGHPEIILVKADENSKPGAVAEVWHTDSSCDAEPPKASILYMHEVPANGGGDTMFANMYAAYDTLSEPTKRMLEGLTAVHDAQAMIYGNQASADRGTGKFPRNEHPVVRTHPETGRKLLFVNGVYTTHIVQLSKFESDSLLGMLYRHMENPQFQCRFKWRPGSIAFWDNRSTQHRGIWDFYPLRRVAHRVAIL
jgi:taurine dioxygenase